MKKPLIVLTDAPLGNLPAVDLRMSRELGLKLEDPSGKPLSRKALLKEEEVYVRFGEIRIPVGELDYDPSALKEPLPGLDLTIDPLPWPAYRVSFPIAWEEQAKWSSDLAKVTQVLLTLASWGKTEGLLVPKVDTVLYYTESSPKHPLIFFVIQAPLVPFLVRALREASTPPPPSLERGGLAVAEWEGRTELVRVERVYETEARVALRQKQGQVVLPLDRLQPLPKGVFVSKYDFEPVEEIFELGYDDLTYRLKKELGFKEAVVTTPAAPLQIEGTDEEGRTFYFRERGGHASLCLSYRRGISVDKMLDKDDCVYVSTEWPSDEEENWKETAFRVIQELYLQARRILARRLGASWLPSTAFKVEEGDLAALEVSLTPKETRAVKLKEVHPGVHLVLSKGKVVGVRISEEALAYPEIIKVI